MKVTNNVSVKTYFGNGTTTVWPFSFSVGDVCDLSLIVTAADGTETPVGPSEYRVQQLDCTPGGTITYPLSGPALMAGQILTLLYRQPVACEEEETCHPDHPHHDHCVQMDLSDSAGMSLTLPPLAQLAGKSLKFDATVGLVPTRHDCDHQSAGAAAASAAAAATSAAFSAASAASSAADRGRAEAAAETAVSARDAAQASAASSAADRGRAETAAQTAVSARDAAQASAATAASIAASIGQEMVEVVTTNRTAVSADRDKVFAVNAAAGPVTITLPTIASVGEPFRLTVKKIDGTANAVSVSVSGTDTLDGGTAPLLLRSEQGGVRLNSDIDASPDNWVSQSFGLPVGDATPIGAEMWFAGTTPPAGWVIENGALLSRAVYPGLWAFAQSSGMLISDTAWSGTPANRSKFSSGDGSTTFRLPDLTTDGLFIRAQAADAPDFGRRQEDELKSHGHDVLTRDGSGGLPGGRPIGWAGSGANAGTANAGAATATGGTETRPKNAGRLPIIKAFSVPVDASTLDTVALAAQVTTLLNTTRRKLLTVTDTLVLPLPAGYSRFRVELENVLSATSAVSLLLQVSADGGATWAGSGYKLVRIGSSSVSSALVATNADSASALTLLENMAGAGGPQVAVNGQIDLTLLPTAGINARFVMSGLLVGGYIAHNTGSGRYASAEVNAVRIIASSGTLTGTAVLYGEP